jgi:hypothetical protein
MAKPPHVGGGGGNTDVLAFPLHWPMVSSYQPPSCLAASVGWRLLSAYMDPPGRGQQGIDRLGTYTTR